MLLFVVQTNAVVWKAPELLQGKHGIAQYGPSVDCYAFSVGLWELFNAKNAFADVPCHFDVMDQVLLGARPTSTETDRIVPPGLMAIIDRGWNQDPEIRISSECIRAGLEQFANPKQFDEDCGENLSHTQMSSDGFELRSSDDRITIIDTNDENKEKL